MKSPLQLNRRRFITAGAALAAPLIFPACSTSHRKIKANNKINVGVIGCGNQGGNDTEEFLKLDDCRVVATCDVDSNHLRNLTKKVNQHYQSEICKPHSDFREVMARPDVDVILCATPDHWHELVAVAAAKAGKDIYGEKPLAHTIAEQQAIVRAVQRHNCIWQTGSWQRSVPSFHKAAEIVRNGLIGDVTHVEVGLPSGFNDNGHSGQYTTPTQPPPELNYDMWLGPSAMEPYIRARSHRNWRWNYNTGGGQLMDWIGHHCDIAHWGLGFDNNGPSEIEGHGDFPPRDAVWNSCTRYRIELNYPQKITMTIAGGYPEIKPGTKWIGTHGWVYVNRGVFEASNEDWQDMKQLPEELRKVKLPISTNHEKNFLDSVRSRQPTLTPAETAHHSSTPGHLGLISMLVGRKIRWDVGTEKILDDPAASKLLSRPFRSPWKM